MNAHRRILALTALCASTLLSASFPANAANAGKNPRIEIVTSEGKIVVALDSKHAPKTVANFLHYVDGGFYNGGTFFRAIPGFVIQGGNQPHEQPSDPTLVLESPKQTGIRNTDGAISMARTNDPNSATSEFFICDGDQAMLDGDGTAASPGYAAFGHVVSGMNIVRLISHQKAEGEMLVAPVQIVKIVRLP